MKQMLTNFMRIQLPPPHYLSIPTAGIDVSASGIKFALFKETLHGLELAYFGEERLPAGAIVSGEISDRATVVQAIKNLKTKYGIHHANVTLPEARGYLFEADVTGAGKDEWRTASERHLDEYVPLPSAEVSFDVVPLSTSTSGAHLVGVGYARRVVEASLSVFEEANVVVRSIESEIFAIPRALLPHGDQETILIIDIGKTTTKLLITSKRLPRFATTLDIGGHALTLAVQKHFGVTEEEAKRVKAEQGLQAGEENQEYLQAMLSTVSVIREEIVRRLDYWQSRQGLLAEHAPVTKAILVGGNATVRGLPEYLQADLQIPVELGDVFKNMASRNDWLPPLDYTESLAYGTAIGLALREYVP